jgi:hypothetical protein
MMKSLVVLCLIAVASAVTNHPLSDITGVLGTFTVTSTFPDTAAAPVLAACTYPTTYDSSVGTLASFTIVAAGTYSGNNTVIGGSVTFSNGGDNVVAEFSCTPVANAFGCTGTNFLKFLNSGSYSPSITLQTATSNVYTNVAATAAAVAVTATAYVPQTVSAFNFVTPQSAGCDATSCTGSPNGTATLAPSRANTYLQAFFRSTSVAATGVVFSTGVSVASGAADFNNGGTSLNANIGGLIGGVWSATESSASIDTEIPTGATFALSAQVIEQSFRGTYYNEATIGALQSSATLNVGGTADTTAPTCTVVTIAPDTITSDINFVTSTLTITCGDGTGTGVWIKGAFATVSVTTGNGGSQTIALQGFSTATSLIGVPPYISGSLTIIGVWAVDNSGNAALYGSCGGVSGYDSLGCTPAGGSSSASSVTVSLFALAFVAISALFA